MFYKKKLFLNFFEYSLENTCAGVSLFLRDSNTGVFLWVLRNFQERLFWRTSTNDCFWNRFGWIPCYASSYKKCVYFSYLKPSSKWWYVFQKFNLHWKLVKKDIDLYLLKDIVFIEIKIKILISVNTRQFKVTSRLKNTKIFFIGLPWWSTFPIMRTPPPSPSPPTPTRGGGVGLLWWGGDYSS